MKKQCNLLFLVLLSLLTLFSSCTVRKAVLVELNIPVTNQLNPSKTTVPVRVPSYCGVSNCIYLPSETPQKELNFSADYIVPVSNLFINVPKETKQQLAPAYFGYYVSDKVPIYILYKKMKLWV